MLVLRAGKPVTVFPPRWAENGAWIWALLWAELLRLAESRSSPPPRAADCNSTELVALTAGGELPMMGRCLCDLKGRRPCRPGAERLGGVGDRPNLTEWDELWAVGWGLFWVKLLRLVEPRGSKLPPRRPATRDARFGPRRLQPAKVIALL